MVENVFKRQQFFATSTGKKCLTFLPIFVLSAHDYFKIHNLKRLKIKNSNWNWNAMEIFLNPMQSSTGEVSIFKWLEARTELCKTTAKRPHKMAISGCCAWNYNRFICRVYCVSTPLAIVNDSWVFVAFFSLQIETEKSRIFETDMKN